MIASAFLYHNMEIIILLMLASLTIFSCSYLYRLSYRSQFSIPIMKSEQEKWFQLSNLKSKEIKIYSKIKNSTNKYQKYIMIGKNNSSKSDHHNQIKKTKEFHFLL